MDSALRPRDIQARIRAGESVEVVAQAAGVPVERIDAFAAPVIAERDHVAGLALSSPVRRRGETTSNRMLRTAATEQLISRRIDPDDVRWDAFLLGARRWRIRATFDLGDETREALFVFDLNGRFSIADSEDARWLIGESLPEHKLSVGAQGDDELALVRVVSDDPSAFAEDADEEEVDDAYREAALTEVDGVYDIVAGGDPGMDALYDMLASFDEDSVRIYSGLVHPQAPVVADAPSADTPDLPEGARVEPLYQPEDVLATRRSDRDAAGPLDADAGEPEAPQPAATHSAEPQPEEPEQPSLVEADKPVPRKKPRAKRASVPSWDEIMFGSPRQGPQKS